MIFDKILNANQDNGGALKSAAVSNNAAQADQGDASARLEITNVWSGPIIILSGDSQMDLEKHYLNYSSTIKAESFEAIFRGQNLDER